MSGDKMRQLPVATFKIPDDVDIPRRQCNAHGEYYGDVCDTCEREEQLRKRQASVLKYEYEALGLPPRYFGLHIDSFKIERQGQQDAKDAVGILLEDGYKALLFSGLVGTGKTHLACTALTHWTDRKKGKALYTTAERMFRSIRETWKTKEPEQDVIDIFVEAKLLVIDEVVEMIGADREKKWLSEIISDRYNKEYPTIIISNLSWKELKGEGVIPPVFDERAADKLKESGKVIVFEWESYRGKK